jgi:hypothetical protein
MNSALPFPELLPFVSLLRTQLQQAFRTATERARVDCRVTHVLGSVFDMLRAIALARSLALAYAVDPAAEISLKECLSFELDFETTITWSVEGGQVISQARSQKVPLNWTNNWSAQHPLDYFSFSFPQPADCSMTLDPHQEAPFKVALPFLRDFQLRAPENLRIVADVDVGRGAETITISCPDGTATGTAHYYDGIYVFHNFMPTFTIADWSFLGGSVFAKRDYNDTFNAGEGTITEATHFVLRHVPR